MPAMKDPTPTPPTQPSIVKRYRKTFLSLGTIAGAFVSISAALTVLNISIPRPAWAYEVVKLAGNIVELDSRVTTEQLNSTRKQWYENQRAQDHYEQEREKAPSFLLDEQLFLEQRMHELQMRLNDLGTQKDG